MVNSNVKTKIILLKKGSFVKWDKNKFLKELRKNCSREVAKVGETLCNFSEKDSDEVSWGRGDEYGTMTYKSKSDFGLISVFQITSRGQIKFCLNLLRQKEDGTFSKITKKEGLKIQRDIDRLQKSIGGVTEMGGLPDALFIIDVNRESIAVSEASKMGIPIVGIVDSNSNPEGIDYVIPGNDDSIRSIALFTEAVADACIVGSKAATGLKQEAPESGPSIVRRAETNPKEESKDTKKGD